MQRLSKAKAQLVHAAVKTTTYTDDIGLPWQCDCHCYNPEQERFFDESDDSLLWLVTSKSFNSLWSAISSFWK